ncbi:MAG: type II secretion system F family protein [Acidimicrobiales bacterium]
MRSAPVWAVTCGALTGLLGAAVVAARGATRRRRVESRLGLVSSPTASANRTRHLVDGIGRPPPWLVAWLSSAAVPFDHDRAWRVWLASGVGAVVVLATLAGPGGAVVAVVATTGLPAVVLRAQVGRDSLLIERALPSTLEAMARSLRSGGSVRLALAEATTTAAGPLASELSTVGRAVDRGIPIRDALAAWAETRPLPGVRLAVAALELGLDAGVGLARNLDGVAATLHDRAEWQREVRTLSSQARYSAGVLAAAPVVFVFVAALIDPATVGFLLRTPLGLGCLVLGLTLDAGGAWWMVGITKGAA